MLRIPGWNSFCFVYFHQTLSFSETKVHWVVLSVQTVLSSWRNALRLRRCVFRPGVTSSVCDVTLSSCDITATKHCCLWPHMPFLVESWPRRDNALFLFCSVSHVPWAVACSPVTQHILFLMTSHIVLWHHNCEWHKLFPVTSQLQMTWHIVLWCHSCKWCHTLSSRRL